MSRLRKNLKEYEAKLGEISDAIEAVGVAAEEEGRDLNETDQATIDSLTADFETCENNIKLTKKQIEVQDRIHNARAIPESIKQAETGGSALMAQGSVSGLPAVVASQKSKCFTSNYDCYASGQWLMAALGNRTSYDWCRDRGMIRNDGNIGTPSEGGYTVPQPLAETIIRLVEEYGVYRQYSRQAVMTSNTLDVPKRADGLTVYYPGEGNAITASDITFAQVNLVAKKYAQHSVWSTELNEDSVISMTDLLATEMAWAFARAEDTNSFLGDGGAGFGTITGINSALLASSTITAGAGATLSTITLDDLQAMVGKLPQYAGLNPRWFVHSYVYHTVFIDLLAGLGGTDMRQYESGGEMMLLGYPVTFTQVLPGSNAGANDMVAVFGDLALGSYVGTRRNVTIRVLNELFAVNDQIGITGTMRADSVIHDVGTATATDPAGAIVKLNLAAT